jgi:hypothetical protein
MAQTLFTTVNLNAAAASNIYVKVGFVPARIELINLTKTGLGSGPTATVGWRSLWVQGMATGSSLNTVYATGTTTTVPIDGTLYNATNGITLLNPLGSEMGQYGAVVSGFTNASPGVLTVDSTLAAGITAGSVIRVALVADNQSSAVSLNGVYYVASVTATTITLGTYPGPLPFPYTGVVVQSPNTTASSVYISGGVVTLLQNANLTIPNPPHDIYSNVPSWYNEAIQGFTIGTAAFPGATYASGAGDLILVSAWDAMTP